MKEILVSIICNTYNQEKYIAQAIESFLKQKTDFAYEVIIHDDASTDGTAEIIQKYEKLYPHIIKPIYESINQYSKGVKITATISLPKARGKYFALCEGDDYWIDPYKLQKQVDYMEKHPECTLCIHNGVRVNVNGERKGTVETVKSSRIVECSEVISGGGGFCVTNSILAPIAITRELPSFLQECALDYFWQIYLACMGTTYCFSDEMSAYRVNSVGSWTRRMRNNDEAWIKFHFKFLNSIKAFDVFTEHAYQRFVEEKIVQNQAYIFLYTKEFKKLKQEPYKTYIKTLSTKKKIKFYLKIYCPWLLKITQCVGNN